MEDNSNTFTPEQSLELIGKFILNYRKNLKEKSYYFLLWGWLIIFASVSHFIILRVLLARELYDKIMLFTLLNWTIFPLAGIIITMFHFSSEGHRKAPGSHIDKFIKTLWQLSAVAIVMELVFCFKINYHYPTPFILTVIGLATTLTGITIRFRPLTLGGIMFFIIAIISAFFLNEYQLLINAVALIFGYLVPGYMLRASKSE